MPANLTPEYKKAELEFRAAATTEEKIAALEHMMAVIPKHKGTEKMQADLKKRISKFREQAEKSGGKRGDLYFVRAEGAGQVILLGPPNSGKSSLMRRLTNARPEVGEYPFTTTKPFPGMMEYEDIKIQLVDLGPAADGELEPFHKNLARTADLTLLVVDFGAADPALDTKQIIDALARSKTELVRTLPEEVPEYGVKPRPALIALNKYDIDEDDILLGEFRAAVGDALDILPISCADGRGVEELRRAIFSALDIIRVYSKIPGKPPDMASPFIMRRGGTLMDFARQVHKEFAEGLRYARIWGTNKELFDGQMVQRDYKLSDKDVIELHV